MEFYIFTRSDGFYPLELRDDTDAIRNAEMNPGTQTVQKLVKGYGITTIWEAVTHKRSDTEQ